jgi:hypothetical protein
MIETLSRTVALAIERKQAEAERETLPSFVPPPKVPATFRRFSCWPRRAIVFAGGNTMKLFGTREIDNRDSEQVYGYMEARIEVLKRRIHELEAEKQALHSKRFAKNYAASSRSIAPYE